MATTPSSRSRLIASYPCVNGETVEVSISYPTCSGLPRVYSLHVQPIEWQRYSDGAVIKRYTPSRGYRSRLQDAPRFNARELERLATDPATLERAETMIARVLADAGTERTGH